MEGAHGTLVGDHPNLRATVLASDWHSEGLPNHLTLVIKKRLARSSYRPKRGKAATQVVLHHEVGQPRD